MAREIGTRAQIALLLYSTLNVVLFTAGVYVVMLSPTLNAYAGFWLAGIVAASVIVTAPIAWGLAPRLNADYWRKKMLANPSPLASAPTREF